MYLKSSKLPHISKDKKYTAIFPIGSCEQHGPFLPFGTDTYIIDACIKKVHDQHPNLLILPTLEVSCSSEFEGYFGTLWISEETFLNTLNDVCYSVSSFTTHLVIANWHGGNKVVISKWLEKYQGTLHGVSLSSIDLDTPEALAKTEELLQGPYDDHAGNSEISMMLAIDEQLVEIPDADYPKHHIVDPWGGDGKLFGKTVDGIVDNHPKWVINKKHGEIFIQDCVEIIATHLTNLSSTETTLNVQDPVSQDGKPGF